MSRVEHSVSENELRPPRAPAWMGRVLVAAAIYNVIWGGACIVAPGLLFDLMGVDPPRYPQLWQVIGMIVGVYGIGYAIAARDPYRHWPIVLVGLLGKTFGPLGYASGVVAAGLGLPYPGLPSGEGAQAALPAGFGWTIITNDLVWWLPFAAMLWGAMSAAQHPATRFGGVRTPTIDAALEARTDPSGRSLRELSEAGPLVLVLVRHAGCTFCRTVLEELGTRLEGVSSAGGSVVVAHLGESDGAIRPLLERFGLGAVEAVADPRGELYRALELPRGRFGQLFGLREFARGLGAASRGHWPRGLAGDGLQLGGAFVIRGGRVVAGQAQARASAGIDARVMDAGLQACDLPPGIDRATA